MELQVHANSRRLGFTLIELMVVFVLVGIMTAMIIPAMRGTYEDALLRSTSRKLVNVLNLASTRAIALNQPHRVRLDHKNGRYSSRDGYRKERRDRDTFPSATFREARER